MQDKKSAKLVPLSELIVSINSGLNPRNNFKLNEEDGTCLYINVKNLQANEEDIQMCDRIPISAMETIKKKCNLEIGDILIPAIFTNKPLAIMVNENLKNIGISENVYAIKPNDKVDGRYLLYMLRTSFVQNQIKKMVDNKQLARITKNMLKEIQIPLEETDTQHRIANFMYEIDRARLVMSIMQSKMNFVSENFVIELNEQKMSETMVYVYHPEETVDDITQYASKMYKQISKIQNDIIDQRHNRKRRMKNEKN